MNWNIRLRLGCKISDLFSDMYPLLTFLKQVIKFRELPEEILEEVIKRIFVFAAISCSVWDKTPTKNASETNIHFVQARNYVSLKINNSSFPNYYVIN